MPVLISLVTLGAVGLFLAMPGKGTWFSRAGQVLLIGAGALVLTLLLPKFGASAERPWFGIMTALALFGAVRMITHKRPVYSALYFMVVIIAIAGMLVLMNAEFLAFSLVIIYAGAILVTYLFVIMLAQQGAAPARYDSNAREPLVGVIAGFVLLAVISARLLGLEPPLPPISDVGAVGTVVPIGELLFTEYVVAIQLAGVLLLAAMVGAIAVARRKPITRPDGEDG